MKNKLVSIIFIICILFGGICVATGSLKTSLVGVNGLFQKLINRSYIEDNEANVYRLDNGHLVYSIDKIDNESIAWFSDNTSAFAEELAKENIPLLYVQIPFKIKDGDNKMPAGCYEYANSNANALVSTLKNQGVNVYDLRDDMSNLSSEEYSSKFYKTDQHWTNETALWAADSIAKNMHKICKTTYQGKLFDQNNFSTKTYENWFLGSFGKKTGSLYAGVDDYNLVLPKYDTSFKFHAVTEKGDIDRSGNFEEALLDKKNLEKDLYNNNTYETYTGGNYKLTKITNKKNPNGSKVLLIRDSFSCSMMPFLALSYSELDSVDLRYYKQSISKLATKGNYDAVIIAYNPSVYGESAFTFD